MKLSVIIVNYNVKHFIEQCLHSVLKASEKVPTEVFVVDNNSVDGSVALIREKFPNINLIENKTNTGFSVANNQAIRHSTGEYILLLNPDTVVQEDTFEKVVHFMDTHPDAGALGVKMLDGKGNFAPESKRGLPTPGVAFYKIFGFSRLFPKSRRFGRYHLGYLGENDTNEVDVLSGAFMLLRKSVLDKTGLLDESFFMYGEDIDLSYRVKLAGYKNYYFPETQIIHYKGESTKRGSINYVLIFYKAMALFARKHFSSSNAFWFSLLINFAIYLRAGMAIAVRLIKTYAVPALDFAAITAGLYLVKYFYVRKYDLSDDFYSERLVDVAFPAYSLMWLMMVYLSGGYDFPVKFLKIFRGVIVGTGLILIGYSLLPEHLRFSRALILLGTAWAMASFVIVRLLLHLAGLKSYRLNAPNTKRIAIIGEEKEFNRVYGLLKQTKVNAEFTGFVSAENNGVHNPNYIGKINQINEIIDVHRINEIIFCARDISSSDIINNMLTLVSSGVDFKIAPPESLSIIGSSNIDTAGDLYVIDVNSVSRPENKRKKRLLDLCVCFVLLAGLPLVIWFQQHKANFIANLFKVLFGFYSWVGYGKVIDRSLPVIKPSILSPADVMGSEVHFEKKKLLNFGYAKDYKIEKDLSIIWACFSKLGN
ncbi:MAG: glycosyltransferase [Bacteroidetes bacterium]|nr:glycosyltransferase [Bacteroidota bacterium]